MYLVSQRRREIVNLHDVWIATKGDKYCIMHDSGNPQMQYTELASYATEPEAVVQMNGVALALERGDKSYGFD